MTYLRKTTFWLALIIAILSGYLIGWKFPLVSKINRPTAIGVAYENKMRLLWESQAFWLRNYLISIPSSEKSLNALLANQDAIGNSIKPYFDNTTGDKLSAMLKTHMLMTVDLINASRNGRRTKTMLDQWYTSGDELISYVSSLNPEIDKKLSSQLWREFQGSVLNEIDAYTRKDVNAESDAFVVSFNHISLFSDSLSLAFEKQFPEQF